MDGRSRNLVHGVAAVAVGFAGVMAGRCSGSSCGTCLACVVPGVALVMFGVIGRGASPKKRESTSSCARPSGAGGHASD
jgi:hypothetical protein